MKIHEYRKHFATSKAASAVMLYKLSGEAPLIKLSSSCDGTGKEARSRAIRRLKQPAAKGDRNALEHRTKAVIAAELAPQLYSGRRPEFPSFRHVSKVLVEAGFRRIRRTELWLRNRVAESVAIPQQPTVKRAIICLADHLDNLDSAEVNGFLREMHIDAQSAEATTHVRPASAFLVAIGEPVTRSC